MQEVFCGGMNKTSEHLVYFHPSAVTWSLHNSSLFEVLRLTESQIISFEWFLLHTKSECYLWWNYGLGLLSALFAIIWPPLNRWFKKNFILCLLVSALSLIFLECEKLHPAPTPIQPGWFRDQIGLTPSICRPKNLHPSPTSSPSFSTQCDIC